MTGTPDLNTGSIVVRVELHSNGNISEIARMYLAHTGDAGGGRYDATTIHGGDNAALNKGRRQRDALVSDYPRVTHVWQLVTRALIALRYGK